MTLLPFSQVVLPCGQAEVKGCSGEVLAGYPTSAKGAGSRMCKEQNPTDSSLEPKTWRAAVCYLKACQDFREPLQRQKLALLVCFLLLLGVFSPLCTFVKKLIFLFIIWFESRTQISIANRLHAGLVVLTVMVFFSLFLSIQALATFKSHCISNYPGDST